MKTRLYPMVQFKKDTWEIDEFECASVFVLVGKEKAMVIDAGIGIGDLIGAIRMTITDKPPRLLCDDRQASGWLLSLSGRPRHHAF